MKFVSELLLNLRFYLITLLANNHIVICNAKFVGRFEIYESDDYGIFYNNAFIFDEESEVLVISSNLP